MNIPVANEPTTYLSSNADHTNTTAQPIVESLGQAIFLVNSAGELSYLNQSANNLLRSIGVNLPSAHGAVGLKWRELFAGQCFPGWQNILTSVTATVEPNVSTLIRYETPNTVRHFAATVDSCRCNGSSSGDRVVSLREVTKELTNLQRQANLHTAAERGSLLSWITHDMNNFLGMILGGVEIAQINLGKGNLEKVTATLEKLKGNVGKAEQFTSALAESTRMETRKALLNLNDVVSDTAAFARTQKKFGRVEVRLALCHNLPPFALDPNQIALLLLSLLDNGADAIIESGRADGTVTVTTVATDTGVILTVTDNGVGLPANIKDRLFRAHLTTKPNARGYGLVNCARIIMNHDASFTVSSEPSQGATFTFTFPFHPVDRTQGSDGKS
ncbi:MAG: HAMP domain-containing sensor histidine kinase [Candidatus Zixiibacteriota bacterium]